MKIVDLLLGRLPAWEQRAVKDHTLRCPRCRKRFDEWNEWLGEDRDMPAATEEAADKTRLVSPRRTVKDKLRIHVLMRKLRNGFKPRPVLVSAVLGMIVLTLFGLFGPLAALERQNTSNIWNTDRDILNQMSIQIQPDTVKYDLVPSAIASQARGFAWVNKQGGEMLILIEGLHPMENRDYQVWFIWDAKHSNIGLLRWNNGKAHLHYRGQEVRNAIDLVVSLEPKGGSWYPTGPDAVRGNLQPDWPGGAKE